MTPFVTEFNRVADEVHVTAMQKGWWDRSPAEERIVEILAMHCPMDELKALTHELGRAFDHNHGQSIALMHAELSEALEGLRVGNPPDDKVPEFTSAEVELADVIIRIMDVSRARGWKVAEALEAKRAMNKTRAFKHGGKAF